MLFFVPMSHTSAWFKSLKHFLCKLTRHPSASFHGLYRSDTMLYTMLCTTLYTTVYDVNAGFRGRGENVCQHAGTTSILYSDKMLEKC